MKKLIAQLRRIGAVQVRGSSALAKIRFNAVRNEFDIPRGSTCAFSIVRDNGMDVVDVVTRDRAITALRSDSRLLAYGLAGDSGYASRHVTQREFVQALLQYHISPIDQVTYAATRRLDG